MKNKSPVKSILKRSKLVAIVLAILIGLFGPVSPVSAAAIDLSVTPGRPHATPIGGTVTFGFAVTYESIPSYAIVYLDLFSTDFCRFYDMDNTHATDWNNGTLSEDCFGFTDAEYIYDGVQPSGSEGSPQTFTISGIDWVVPTGTFTGIHGVYVDYFNRTGGLISSESGGFNTFIVSPTTNIIMKKFYDIDGNGTKDTGESYASTPQFELCLKTPSPYNETSCQLTNTGTGFAEWDDMPIGFYLFTETAQSGWAKTTPAYNFGGGTSYRFNVTTTNNTVTFGNTMSDMVCSNVTASALSPSNQMTFRLNFEKLVGAIQAQSPTVQLYFTQTTNHEITWGGMSWSSPLAGVTFVSGDGTSGTPYLFNLPNLVTTGSRYIDVTVTLGFPDGRATSGNFNANQVVDSTYESILTSNNSCSKTLPFDGTAVTAASLTVSAQASGVQLSWWADAAFTGWTGFKLQSRPHLTGSFTDVPGGFVTADVTAQGGKTYTFLDTSALTGGLIDYQVVPVLGGVDQAPVLTLTTWYGKIFMPVLK
jgi:hypothetical protein